MPAGGSRSSRNEPDSTQSIDQFPLYDQIDDDAINQYRRNIPYWDYGAVPGSPLDERCRGCNDLIRQGAHLTETVEDVLAHLPAAPSAEPSFFFKPDSKSMPETANPASAATKKSSPLSRAAAFTAT